MATSPTTHWEPRALPPEDVRRLLSWLFAPEADLPQETDQPEPSDCGFDAACERFDRHLAWFDRDARARKVAR